MYVFDFCDLLGHVRIEEPLRPSSPWMPFPALISVLSKSLPSSDIAFISKFHKDYKVSAFLLVSGVLIPWLNFLWLKSELPMSNRKRRFRGMN